MKFFTCALLAVLMIGIALPAEQAFARYNDDDSQQDDSYGRYDDSDDDDDNEYDDSDEYEDNDSDEYEDEESDEDSDSYTAPISPIRPVGTMTDAERLTLLQQLLARVIELLNQLKGIQATTPSTPATSTPTQSYTASEVATHNTSASCWSIINSKVYDLTSYISRHPGGSSNITRICGKDGTSAFSGQHGGDSKPERALAGFYLAPLAQ